MSPVPVTLTYVRSNTKLKLQQTEETPLQYQYLSVNMKSYKILRRKSEIKPT